MIFAALEKPLHRAREASIAVVPFPTRGWNTRDKHAENPKYAPIMTNIRPHAGRGKMRGGYDIWSTGLPSAAVNTLLHFHGGATEKLFAVVGTEIYDVTSTGAVGAAVVTGLTNSKFQQTMHATTSGQYLVAVNGADGVRTYSGSAWASQSITGVTAANLIGVASHKNRLWFIENATLSLWYLGTYAISGAATELDLAALCQHGGELQAVATWSYDGGSGPDDYLVGITTEGEVVIYAGTNPADAAAWALVGIFKIDRPIGRRCVVKYGADLAVLTVSGVVLLSQVLAGVAGKDQLSDPIRDEFVDAAIDAFSTYGWQVLVYSKYGEIVTNIPKSSSIFEQFNYVTLNQAWWPSRGQSGICWQESGGNLYFGGNAGLVAKADIGQADDVAAIVIDYQPSWSRFGTSNLKQFTMMRPNLFTDGTLTLLGAMKTDYDESAVTAALSAVTSVEGSIWGDASGDGDLWDEAIWGGGVSVYARWSTANGQGIVGAPRIRLQTTTAQMEIGAIDVAFTRGDIL